MLRYIARRLLQAIPIFFGITILSYILMTAAPGGPVLIMLANNPRVTMKEKEAIAARLGVSDPWPIQYIRWLTGDDWMKVDKDGDGKSDYAILVRLDADKDGNPDPPGTGKGILRGDFGVSIFAKVPVIQVIGDRVGATLELGIAALLLSLAIGIPIGIIAAVQRGGWFDNLTRVLSVMFSAVPIFWLGLVLLLIFGADLKILPMGSRCSDTDMMQLGACPTLPNRLSYLILPTIVLATGGIAGYSRYMRAAMLDVIHQDYIRTAQAKGLPNNVVWFKHAARNALIPLATFLGPAITGVIGGAVITETIFSWPGLGRLGVTSVVQQDYPVVMALVIITSIATIIGFLISDILYAIIDPRIRFS